MSVVLDCLDDLQLLLENPGKTLQGAKIKKFRETDPNVAEYNEIKKELYRGQKIDPKSIKKRVKSHKKWLKDPKNKEKLKEAIKKRDERNKDPERRKKFMEAIKERDRKRKEKKQNETKN